MGLKYKIWRGQTLDSVGLPHPHREWVGVRILPIPDSWWSTLGRGTWWKYSHSYDSCGEPGLTTLSLVVVWSWKKCCSCWVMKQRTKGFFFFLSLSPFLLSLSLYLKNLKNADEYSSEPGDSLVPFYSPMTPSSVIPIPLISSYTISTKQWSYPVTGHKIVCR